MKRVALAVLFLAVAFAASCACIPREWCMRNGLTDEQIDGMFGRFKDPNFSIRITRETWNNIKFNTHRYNNVTNWLGVIGRTNNYARLVVPTMATNEVLRVENGTLSRSNSVLRTEVEILEPDAKEYRKAAKAAEKATKKDSKNFEKWVKDTEKARDKSGEDMAEFYDAILEIATGSVPNE